MISGFIHFFERTAKLEAEWRRGFLSLLEENPHARLLDLGCYQGNFTVMAAQKVGTSIVLGIDVLEETRGAAESKGIKYYQGDLNEKLPFEDGSFDVVCTNQVIEHLSNTDGFIKEMSRVLVDGGYAVVSTPNLVAVHTILLLTLGWQPLSAHVSDEASWAGTWIRDEKGEAFMKHRRLFTLRALRDLLEYHGFKIEKSIGSGFFLFPTGLSRLACHIDKRHANIITVKVRKGTKG